MVIREGLEPGLVESLEPPCPGKQAFHVPVVHGLAGIPEQERHQDVSSRSKTPARLHRGISATRATRLLTAAAAGESGIVTACLLASRA